MGLLEDPMESTGRFDGSFDDCRHIHMILDFLARADGQGGPGQYNMRPSWI